MNTVKHLFFKGIFLIVFPALLALSSCQDESWVTFTANVPVYLSYEDLRSSIKNESTQEVANPGKIYFKDNYIFINEYRKGVHVINNSNPSDPQEVTFLNIPGNVDIAIRGNYLFADSYIDLVVIDISDLQNVQEVDRIENSFEYYLPEYDTNYELATVDEKKGVVTAWEIKKTREKINPGSNIYPIYRDWLYAEDMAYNAKPATQGGSGGSDFGIGGSMARFGQFDKYLFVLTQNMLKSYEVSSQGNLTRSDSIWVNWGMETMFILNETMFLGSQSGMFIYDLTNLPTINYISEFSHFRACDPVIADEKFAYVTLKVGGACGWGSNLLEVINIENIKNPKLEKTYQMAGPQGLGKDDELLFICDGDAGLKIFDASRPDVELPLITKMEAENAYDVIPINGILFMIADDGFYQ
ncbi:MAG: hypothetical protein JW798_09265, partial [Prolixibacteraceae bacterium]|nr:hypothetical protein [Prolixibacteraceae bacterium]